MTTNEKIAESLLLQTYEERLEFATPFVLLSFDDLCSYLDDWAQDNLPEDF